MDFPDPRTADADGLIAIGGDLSRPTLLAAYRRGIFPWFEAGGPILWWSPDPRMVLFPDEFHCSRRLARRIRQGRFRISENEDFMAVVEACAARPEGTWITPGMKRAYGDLFAAGYAHSIEVWEGRCLAGGLYGVRLGRGYFAESMFHRRTDASKMALFHLCKLARERGWLFIDCQFYTPHLASLGAREIPRDDFLDLMERAMPPEGTIPRP